MGLKFRRLYPPLGGGGELAPHLTYVACAEAYLRTKWHLDHPAFWPQQTWAENWGLCQF